MQQYRKNLGKVSLTTEGVWNRNKDYEILSIVYEEHTQHGFISRKEVPAGVDINNKEYWMPLNVSGYVDNNMIILSQKTSETAIKSYTLKEAIKSIASVGRKPGAILGFYNENTDRLDIGGRWELWQYNGIDVADWENVNSWDSIYYNYNKFAGWYRSEESLKKYIPFPEIGCYAYIGSDLNEAVIYRCDRKYVWTNTTEHVWDYIKVIVGGNVTVGENGNWFNNGVDTNIPASIKGENGKTPIIRNNNNILEVSYDNVNWTKISDEMAAWFRWQTQGGQQAFSTGKIQITRDGITWTDLSGEFVNNLRISRYIDADETLPTSGIAEGTIYAKGPYYEDTDTNHDYPAYRIWVYAWKGNTLAWVDHGQFTSIAAGIVQDTGDSEVAVMSQKAVTDKLSELGSKVFNYNHFVGKGITFSAVKLHGFTPNRTYKVYLPSEWEDVEVPTPNTYFKFAVSAYLNGKETRLAGDNIAAGVKESYVFTTPEEFDYIQIGGRALSGEKVYFSIYDHEVGKELEEFEKSVEESINGRSVTFNGYAGRVHYSQNDQIPIDLNEGDYLQFMLTSDKVGSIAEGGFYNIFIYNEDGTTVGYNNKISDLLYRVRLNKKAIAVGVYYDTNFIVEDCIIKISAIISNNVVRGLYNKTEKVENQYEVTLRSVSLIATSGTIPNIDTINKTIDFGSDPIFRIGKQHYALRLLVSDATKYRNVSYIQPDTNSGAQILIFNCKTIEFYAKIYDYVLQDNEVVIGCFRLIPNSFDFVSANFPFKFTVDWKNDWSNEIERVDSFVSNRISSLSEFEMHEFKYGNIERSRLRFNKEIGFKASGAAVRVINLPTDFKYAVLIGNLGSNNQIEGGFDSSWQSYPTTYNLNNYTTNSKYIGFAFRKTDETTITPEEEVYLRENFKFEMTISLSVISLGKEVSKISSLRGNTNLSFIAHRGVHVNGIPENSLDAYRYAGYCGFEYAETDFCPTADNELVLMHDSSINRTMYNKSDYTALTETVNVRDKTLAELRENYVLISSDPRMRKPIPTLEEFFITCRNSGVFPIPEIKTSGTTNVHVQKAYELGKKIMGEGNFGFCSFSSSLLDYARSLSEKILLLYINNGILGTTNSVTGKSRESEYTWWYPGYNSYGLTKELVRQYKEAGIKVAVWTVPVSEFDNLLKMEVDCLAGDYLSPSISGLIGMVVKANENYFDFDTDGVVENRILKLSSGQSVSFSAKSRWLGGYYLSIIAKGSFTITAPNLSVAVNSIDTDRFIYQGLVSNTISNFTLTASDESEIEFIEFGETEF